MSGKHAEFINNECCVVKSFSLIYPSNELKKMAVVYFHIGMCWTCTIWRWWNDTLRASRWEVDSNLGTLVVCGAPSCSVLGDEAWLLASGGHLNGFSDVTLTVHNQLVKLVSESGLEVFWCIPRSVFVSLFPLLSSFLVPYVKTRGVIENFWIYGSRPHLNSFFRICFDTHTHIYICYTYISYMYIYCILWC